jgi:hypothetical protein
MVQLSSTLAGRRGGWWGIGFVLGLLVVEAMVTLPTAAESGERIKSFYDINRQAIVIQQVLGILLLVPLLGFVAALDRRARVRDQAKARWFLLVGVLLAASELATNLTALAIAAMSDASPGAAHALTLVGDVADAALFVSIAVFAVVVALVESAWWIRCVALVVAALTFARGIASPLGFGALDGVAPLAFVLFVVMLSMRVLLAGLLAPRRAQ